MTRKVYAFTAQELRFTEHFFFRLLPLKTYLFILLFRRNYKKTFFIDLFIEIKECASSENSNINSDAYASSIYCFIHRISSSSIYFHIKTIMGVFYDYIGSKNNVNSFIAHGK